MLAQLGAMLAHPETYVGSCCPMWSQKIRKMGNSKKTVKRRIFWWLAAYLGAMLARQCGPILGLCWPILGRCWPILELCWPILGLCWPILGLCWPILRPMLAHLEAYVSLCWPILSHKGRKSGKNGKSTKHRKTRGFLATRGCTRWVAGRGRGPSLLRRGEKRLRQCHGQGAPGRNNGLRPLPPTQGAAASGAVSGGLRVAVKGVEANTVTILLREWCESRYCKCWEYPLGYDPLRFILRFSVCCPLLSAFQNKSRKKRKSNNKGNNSTEKPEEEEEGEGEEGEEGEEEEEQQQEQQEGHNYWRTERASGQRPVVPNVAFCTDKKLAVFLLLPPLSPAFLLLLEDGTGLRATACSA